MKHPSLLLLVILLLLTQQTTQALGDFPRHIDPTTLEETEPDPYTLFNLLKLAILETLSGKFTISREFLEWLNATILPEDLDQLLKDYGGILNRFQIRTNLTRFHFQEALEYVAQLEVEDALQSFREGLLWLQKTNETIPHLKSETVDVASKLNVDPRPLLENIDLVARMLQEYASIVNKTIEALEEGKQPQEMIDLLLNLYTSSNYLTNESRLPQEMIDLLLGVMDRAELNLTLLVFPNLSLVLNTSEAFVGECIDVSGRLVVESLPLAGKTITVTIGETSLNTETGANGNYTLTLKVPYIYEEETTVKAVYLPSNPNGGIGPAVASQTLRLRFHTPKISVSCNHTVYPGLPWRVKGNITNLNKPLEGLEVLVEAFGDTYTTQTDNQGNFHTEIRVPAETPLGNTTAIIHSKPKEQIGPAEKTIPLTIKQQQLEYTVEKPWLIVTGLSTHLGFKVSAGGVPLNGCLIRVYTPHGEWEATSNNGQAHVRLRVPILAGSQSYSWWALLDPAEPWVEETYVEESMRVVNLLTLLGACIAAILTPYLLRKSLKAKQYEEPELEESEPTSTPQPIPTQPIEPVDLFRKALTIVQQLTGVPVKPSDTLREYLTRVASKLGTRLREIFHRLVAWYENWLYGRPGKTLTQEAEELVEQMEEEASEA